MKNKISKQIKSDYTLNQYPKKSANVYILGYKHKLSEKLEGIAKEDKKFLVSPMHEKQNRPINKYKPPTGIPETASIAEVKNLRNSISRNLHDEIGSSLSSILMLSTSAQYSLQTNQNEQAKMLIERISSSSLHILEVMDDIIWSINPVNDSFEGLMIRIRKFMNDIIDASGIVVNVQIDASFEKINLSMKEKQNFYMIFKEVFTNAACHSKCKIIDILLQRAHHFIILKITDNGRGFDTLKKFNGNGLENIQQRAKEINAMVNLYSLSNNGTAFTLTMPSPEYGIV